MSQISQARSAEAPSSDRTPSLRWLEWIVLIYGIVLVAGSIVLFLMNAASDQISTLITQQNAASLKLWTNLDYYQHHNTHGQPGDTSLPPGLFEDLVEFSRANATIIKTVHRLDFSNVLSSGTSWEKICAYIIPTDGNQPGSGQTCYFDHFGVTPQTNATNILQQGMYQIELYQAIRDYAQDKSNFYKGFFGAISAYLLPVLYALLGAFLYALRSWPAQGKQRRINSSPERFSRFLMAGIAGIAISAFSALIPSDVLLSPLVLAFVVGYSNDVFTTWLDAYVRKFKHAAGP